MLKINCIFIQRVAIEVIETAFFIEIVSNKKFNQNYYSLINDRAQWLKDQQSKKTISLNFNSYNSFLNQQREKNKRFESLNKYENNLNFKLLKTEKQYIMSNKELLSSRNRWHRNLTKDLYLEEGVKALEMLSLLDKNIILVNNDKLLK